MITWTPVAEEQPPLKEYVLTFCAGKTYPCIGTDRLCLKGNGLVYWDSGNDFGEVTHWAPIPNTP